MTGPEMTTNLTSTMVLGYFESLKSCFYVKLGIQLWFERGDVEKHRAISCVASTIASSFNDDFAAKVLASLTNEVVTNLREDAVTALVLSAWTVFEQVIKDLTVPNYATQPDLLQADFHNRILGFTQTERDEISLFYHVRNAIVHYNGAYHAYRKVDVTYARIQFKSEGHFGEKINVTPKIAMQIVDDLQKYAMKAWSHIGRS